MSRLVSRMFFLPYRIMRRLAIANIRCFFVAEWGDLELTPLPSGLVFAELSRRRLERLREDFPQLLGPEYTGFLENGQARGFGVFDGDSFASFLWMASGNIPGEINRDAHPATRLPLTLPPGIGYVFNVFVLPEYRGQRLYSAMISQLSMVLRDESFTGLLLTTDGSNYSALQSVQRMGFKQLGRSLLFGVGRFSVASYPPQPMPDGIRCGHYAGDRNGSNDAE